MALLETVNPEKAEGEVKEAYSVFMERAGMVPKPFEMLSVSPELQKMQVQGIDYYMQHPTLTFPLLAHIRYLIAREYNYQFCINFNSELLQFVGLDDDQLQTVAKDPSQTTLEEKDKAMLLFVLKAIKTPDFVEQKDVDTLREMGWTDRDIFDAVAHGANMIAPSILMKAFKID